MVVIVESGPRIRRLLVTLQPKDTIPGAWGREIQALTLSEPPSRCHEQSPETSPLIPPESEERELNKSTGQVSVRSFLGSISSTSTDGR